MEPKDKVKYLGAILDQTLSGESMVNSILQRANARLKFLYRKQNFFFQFSYKKTCSHVPYTMPFRLRLFLLVYWNFKIVKKKTDFKLHKIRLSGSFLKRIQCLM